ncbi:hypothetical protein J45TS6_24390 [Paenibacillus sp. J45TS6]|uniref:hypothetical protein n=1 Tax=Paenibacillus sp. J45TS6 TaxID=2807196 RepID=UPI001B160439|nr:hypothetical protein [Paenibacillus sp. J45TS6]GIP43980.1 hypothetical protein J45TS6_24390 [Paenibacillus sp. J45TS6]
MRAIFLRDIRRFLSLRLLFLMLGCTLFSLAKRRGFSQSYDSFVLSMLSDHYYITFFMVPVFLYILFTHLEMDMEYVLIRSKKFAYYFIAKAAAITMNVSIFVLLQLVVFLVVGIGLEVNSIFPSPDSQNSSLEVLIMLSHYFHYPWQAAIVTTLYMIMGLSILSIFFWALHHFLEKRTFAILIITLYFLMVFAMKSKITGLTRIPFIFINNYIIFMYNLTYPYGLQISLITLAMIAGVTAYVIKKHWNKRPEWKIALRIPSGITSYYGAQLFSAKNGAILLAFVIGFGLWKLLQVQTMPNSTQTDYLIYAFWGHGHGYMNMLDWIAMILINGVPIYLLAHFLENEKKDHSILLTIRLRSKWHWGAAIFGVSTLFLLMYTLLLTGGLLLLANVGGFPAGEGTLIPGLSIGMNELMLYLIGSKLLDLLFQFLFLFVIFLWTRHIIVAFIGILVMYALYLFPFSWTTYIPVGLSSLAQNLNFTALADSSIPGLPGKIIMLLLGSLVIIPSLYVLLFGYKKRFQ